MAKNPPKSQDELSAPDDTGVETVTAPLVEPPTAPPTSPPAAPDATVTLDDFCRALSVDDRRIELIGAFHFTERAAGRLSDTRPLYQARYAAFINQPA